MGNKVKYIISFVFISAGLFLMTYHSIYKSNKIEVNEDFKDLYHKVDITVLNDKIDPEYLNKNTGNKQILPLLVLKTKTCALCINNVAEYIELFKENNTLINPISIFLDEKEQEVERFLFTRDLDLPHVVLTSKEVEPLFYDLKQSLIFIDVKSEVAFYKIDISNVPTMKLYKEQQIANAVNMHKNIYEKIMSREK